MKVMHLITGLDLGGAERQLSALVQGKSFFNNIIVSLKDEGVMGKDLADGGLPVYSLNLHKSWKGLWRFWKLLRTEKPDVLQTWLYHADLVGLIMGKLARVPHIVWNLRCSNMDLSQYSRLTRAVFKILKSLSRFPDAIVTNSHAGRNFHLKAGYNPRKWICIPNGIDTDMFAPQPEIGQKLRYSLNIPDNAVVIGMAGRVDPMKDYATFLKAIKHLSSEFTDIHCIIAGEGTTEAKWDHVPAHLHCLGAWKNMPEFMNALDILVLCSSFGEGFPNVVGEAMACGTPIVVTNVGDAALIVQNPAYVVSPESVEELMVALRALLTLSSSERKKNGRQCREKIKNTYSLFRMREGYEKFYNNLILGKFDNV